MENKMESKKENFFYDACWTLLAGGITYFSVNSLISSADMDDGSNVGICRLETSKIGKDVCMFGYQSGFVLVKNLMEVASDCPVAFPPFDELTQCKPYYDNATLTSSCVSGLVSGVSAGQAAQAVKCHEGVRYYAPLVASLLGFSIALLPRGHKIIKTLENWFCKCFSTNGEYDVDEVDTSPDNTVELATGKGTNGYQAINRV